MTVLFSVNTEKVRLRRESFPEVRGEPEDAEQPGLRSRLRQTEAEPCQGRVGAASGAAAAAAPRGEAPGTPKSQSVHPDGMRLRGGDGNGEAAPGCEGNKISDRKAKGDPGFGVQGGLPAALSATCI